MQLLRCMFTVLISLRTQHAYLILALSKYHYHVYLEFWLLLSLPSIPLSLERHLIGIRWKAVSRDTLSLSFSLSLYLDKSSFPLLCVCAIFAPDFEKSLTLVVRWATSVVCARYKHTSGDSQGGIPSCNSDGEERGRMEKDFSQIELRLQCREITGRDDITSNFLTQKMMTFF